MDNGMLLARINTGLVSRVLMPALEEFAAATLANPSALQCEKTEAVYLLARIRSAMTQASPACYIREPNPERLRNAAAAARKFAQPEVSRA